MKTQELIVVGGPNGAGKTTFVESFLKSSSFTYLGADQIAYELCPENVASVAIQASRLFVERINQYRTEGRSVIVESTMSGRSLVKHVEKYRLKGYRVKMIFISLPNASTSSERVKIRVKKGGHHIPQEDIDRRFLKAHRNFWNLYRPLADDWFLYFNGKNGHQRVAEGRGEDYISFDEGAVTEFLRRSGK